MSEPFDDDHDDEVVERSSGRIVNVTGAPIGSSLAADAATGATLLELDDASVFDEIDGGSLRLGGTVYTYAGAGVDNVANTVTIDSGLAADAAEDDWVDVWDALGAAVVREWQADVAVPGAQGNYEPIAAVLSQALTIQFAEGTRDLGPGESVTMELRGTQWTITDAHGKEAGIVNNRNQYDRLTVTFQIPDVTTWTSTNVPSWDSIDDQYGSSIDVGVSGGVELNSPGVYAVNAVLFVGGNEAAAADSSVRLEVVVGTGAYPAPRWAGCGLRGGDANGLGNAASCDVTYWRSGDGSAGDSTVIVYINVANLDTSAIQSILVTLSVQRIF